ncbi:MAG: sigma-70 family RNA polymerase sigma factor [Bacillota bacterium]
MSALLDEVLVKKAQDGDRNSLSELMVRYERKTYNLAYRLMGNHADASDAAQEALVRVCLRLRNFRGDSAFSTWLFRVVTNTCLDELRRRGRLRHASLDDALPVEEGAVPRQAPDEAESPVEYAERHEIQAAVKRAINRLPDEYRVVVIMRDLQGLSYQEIAVMLGTTLGTIKSRLHRARQALRGIIKATEAAKLGIDRIAG